MKMNHDKLLFISKIPHEKREIVPESLVLIKQLNSVGKALVLGSHLAFIVYNEVVKYEGQKWVFAFIYLQRSCKVWRF